MEREKEREKGQGKMFIFVSSSLMEEGKDWISQVFVNRYLFFPGVIYFSQVGSQLFKVCQLYILSPVSIVA